MTRQSWYVLVLTACAIAWVYVGLSLWRNTLDAGMGVCFFKNLTGYPCPSCGTTRSVLALASGDWAAALWWNPMGYVVVFLMTALPLMVCYDWLRGTSVLLQTGERTVALFVRHRILLVLLVLLILGNGIWNICKGI